MKLWLYILFLVALSQDIGLALDLAVSREELSNYLPEKKCQMKWEDSSFDPFRIDFTRTKDKDVISEEDKGCINTIKNTIRERKIEGIVFGRGALDSKVLIGGYVFSPADELGFVNDQGEWVPIYPGKSAILLEITKEKGVFLVAGKNADRTENKFEIVWEGFFQF